IAPDLAFAGGGIVGRADSGEQQQARVVQRPGGENDEVGGLKDFLALRIHIDDAFGAAVLVADAADIRAVADGYALLAGDDGHERVCRLSLRANHAAEPFTKSAVLAG